VRIVGDVEQNWIQLQEVQVFQASSNPAGFTAQYYDNVDFTSLKLTRTDAQIGFDWGTGAPASDVGADTFSVRWTGRIQPRFSETYTFHTVSDDGIRLWINGSLLITNWTDHAPTEDRATLSLVAGQTYDLKLEFYERGGGATAKLYWSSPQQPKALVPAAGGGSTGGTNLARDKATTASVNAATSGRAVDGDTATPDQVWFPSPAPAGTWWRVDLGSAVNVSKVVIYANAVNAHDWFRQFHIECSTTGAFGGEQVTVATETDWDARRAEKQSVAYTFNTRSCRYVRLVADVQQDWVQLQEVEIGG
jgi:hypothetical protein